MTRSQILLAAIITPVTVSAAVDRGQVRLTPADITALEQHAGGAGTSGVAGIRTVILSGDPTRRGPYAIQLRIPARTRIAAHTHRDDRSAVVIAGTWYFGYGARATDAGTRALGPGSFYTEPAGEAHFASTRARPVTVIISGNGPTDTQYVDTPTH
ncbi:MAG: hypothetical protein B7Y45_00485 [Sphingomonas sp. 28-66-16]|nr:MAG: hypothetical protein B7Y45_00485 [Sphingomonas sp. 28-66-16]